MYWPWPSPTYLQVFASRNDLFFANVWKRPYSGWIYGKNKKVEFSVEYYEGKKFKVEFFQKSEDLKATENLLWTILWLAYLGYISSPMFKSFSHNPPIGHLVFHIALPGIWSYSLKSRDVGISRCKMNKHISGFVEEHWFTLYIFKNSLQSRMFQDKRKLFYILQV